MTHFNKIQVIKFLVLNIGASLTSARFYGILLGSNEKRAKL